MPVHNIDISRIFNEMADYLEIEGANHFRVRAYRTAARAVSGLSGNAADMVEQEKDLTEISGIGKDLADKIKTIVKTGSLPQLEKLQERLSPGLMDIMNIPGVGPKKAAILFKELNIGNIEELRKATEAGKVRNLSGFGAKTEKNILEELDQMAEGGQDRTLLVEAEEYAEPLLEYLQQVEGVEKAVLAGSYRRRRETVGDLDILVTCDDCSRVMDGFTGYDDVDKVVSKGKTRTTVILRSGLQVDLRAVEEESYGAALHYFTGSKAHNIAVRKMGSANGYKINEYGVFKDDKRVAGRTEEEIYEIVELPYIEPELREDRGEFEAARDKKLPRLIRLQDLRGDLHIHTKETDGHNTLQEIAEAAHKRGYEYLAVTDHSQQVRVAGGMDEKRLIRQIDAIDQLNEELDNITILKGIEVDILKDGSLDLPDEVLERLDLRICSVHSSFKLSREKQTERILKAMDNPLFNILGHPTGRLLLSRGPYDVDMERILKGARERGCFVELNAQPERLDLNDVHLKWAKELGVRVAISTDAHWVKHLGWIRFGINQARRGWLEADDVLNTRSLKELRKLLRR